MNEQQKAWMEEAMAEIRGQMSLHAPQSTWTFDEQQRYGRALAAAIIARPDLFPAEHPSAITAQRVLASDAPGLKSTPRIWLESIGEGALEFVRQGQRLNPFAEGNASFTRLERTAQILALAVIIGGTIYLFNPRRK